jgi:excisionase family DNA binding protein
MEIQSNQASTMAMVVLPQSVWEGVTNDLQQLKEMLQSRNAEEVGKQWVESNEARKMLGVSQKTWQNYRDKRIIPFSQVGRKIYVRRADLQAFMESHYITSK